MREPRVKVGIVVRLAFLGSVSMLIKCGVESRRGWVAQCLRSTSTILKLRHLDSIERVTHPIQEAFTI